MQEPKVQTRLLDAHVSNGTHTILSRSSVTIPRPDRRPKRRKESARTSILPSSLSLSLPLPLPLRLLMLLLMLVLVLLLLLFVVGVGGHGRAAGSHRWLEDGGFRPNHQAQGRQTFFDLRHLPGGQHMTPKFILTSSPPPIPGHRHASPKSV